MHEPLDIGNKSWEESRGVIVYELNRQGQNLHDFRSAVQSLASEASNQRAADIRSITDASTSMLVRVSILETKLVLYAAGAGGLISFLVTLFTLWISKKI